VSLGSHKRTPKLVTVVMAEAGLKPARDLRSAQSVMDLVDCQRSKAISTSGEVNSLNFTLSSGDGSK